MTSNEQITAYVDALIQKGRISQDMRSNYVEMLTQSEGLAQDVAGSLMMSSDYTKKTMALAEERRKSEAEIAKLRADAEAERQQLKQWEADVNKEIARLRGAEQQTVEMRAQIAAYEQLLRDYNLEGAVPTPSTSSTGAAMSSSNPNPQNPAIPTAPVTDPMYLTTADATQYLRDVMVLQGRVSSIYAQHQQLFGTPLTEDIVSAAMSTGQNPEDYWKVRYNVEARTTEVAAQKAAAEKAALEAEIRSKIMEELSTDPSRVLTSNGSYKPSAGPILDAYAASRAMAHNPLQDAGQQTPPSAPERTSDLVLTRSRISEAVGEFSKHFHPDGTPIDGTPRTNIPV